MKAVTKKTPQNPPEWYQGLDWSERPEPKGSEARPVKVKIVSAGICGTDVGIYQGKDALANAMAGNKDKDVILGHEFCARIVEVHDSARIFMAKLLLRRKNSKKEVVDFIGKRTPEEISKDENFINILHTHFFVSGEMHFTCGECLQCRIGDEHVCKEVIGKGLHEDGAFTDYMLLPANRIILFEDDEIPPQIISFMDALGNTVHMGQSVDLVGRSVLITGAGVQGLMSTAVVKQMGAANVFVTDVAPKEKTARTVDKLAVARKLGADFTFDVGTEEGRASLQKTIAEETEDTGVDVVFEMAGAYAAYKTAFDSLRMGGTLVLLGLPAGKMEVDFSKEIVFKGLTIKGIYGRRVFDTWDLMRFLLAKGLSETLLSSGIVTHELPLEKYDEGFQALLKGEAIKVLLKP